MSAICGILSLSDRAPRLDLLTRMMGKLEQHGPDGSGQWHDNSAGFGHQMMQITPESLKGKLDEEQLKLYTLIWRRTMACQMVPAIFDTVALEFSPGESAAQQKGQRFSAF